MALSVKKLSISLKNVSRWDVRYLFVFVLLVVLALDVWTIKTAVDVVFRLGKQSSATTAPKGGGVRINFTDYDKIVRRMDGAATFHPSAGPDKNPFSTPQSTSQ